MASMGVLLAVLQMATILLQAPTKHAKHALSNVKYVLVL